MTADIQRFGKMAFSCPKFNSLYDKYPFGNLIGKVNAFNQYVIMEQSHYGFVTISEFEVQTVANISDVFILWWNFFE